MKEANVAAKPVAPAFARSQDTAGLGTAILNFPVKLLIEGLTRLGLLTKDLDYHLIRGSMVLIFLLFGYQKWFEYEAQVLIPFISNGPLISWMYPAFGVRGASWFLGTSEWLFGALLFLGFWNKRLGILGAAGSCVTFLSTVSIIPFMPDGWAPSAGGFPAMVGNVPFLMKDVVLFAASFYLLKQDVERLMASQQAGALSGREC
ncbi:MAG: YkgB family protein [Reyranella sp.]